MNPATGGLLVVAERASDAETIRQLLNEDFGHVVISFRAEQFDQDFRRAEPGVIVLGFKTLEQAEHYLLSLYRRGDLLHAMPHRTIVLCHKDELASAYQRCRAGDFDDYVLFWPLAHDSRRLLMAVHAALRSLKDGQAAAAAAQLSAYARRVAELEALVAQQREQGLGLARESDACLQDARVQVGQALEGLERRIVETGLDQALQVREPVRVRQALQAVRLDMVEPPLQRAAQSLKPMQTWIDDMSVGFAGPIEAARELASGLKAGGGQSEQRALVLVVDDDPFLLKLVGGVLAGAGYETVGAVSVDEAMLQLRRRPPNIVLMDVDLADSDGVDLTRQLKSSPVFGKIPVIMLTGHGERETIVRSLQAGAADFIVKPPERDVLLRKIAHCLQG